ALLGSRLPRDVRAEGISCSWMFVPSEPERFTRARNQVGRLFLGHPQDFAKWIYDVLSQRGPQCRQGVVIVLFDGIHLARRDGVAPVRELMEDDEMDIALDESVGIFRSCAIEYRCRTAGVAVDVEADCGAHAPCRIGIEVGFYNPGDI